MDQRGGQAPRRSTLAYEGLPGTVYLLHFACPFGANPSTRAQHYLGWTQNLRRRVNEHRKGRGSGVTRRGHREGVPFVLAQTSPDTTQREAELRLLGPRELCPVCPAFDPCRFLPMHPLTGLRRCLKIFIGGGYAPCRQPHALVRYAGGMRYPDGGELTTADWAAGSRCG